ncbi:Ogt [Symbiodinium natans]|uniref:Ogt protein n=1 Tax=Symbiodinium natans TaxID=878477 RepID=A0A812MZZ0_9DINO|nr:Ogt [Symbiodinium natans]
MKLLNSGHYDEAVRRFKQALMHKPTSVQILNNIGLVYAKCQDYAGAYEWYEKAHRQDPKDVETLFSCAWVERKRQKYQHARELFMQVLELEPNHSKALWLLGDILKTSKDYTGAIQHLETLMRIQPRGPDGHISLAQCYESTKQYPKAVQIYKNILKSLCPGRVDVHFALGKVYFLMKQYRQAVIEFDRVPDGDSRAVEARSYGAKACRELEDHERAISLAESAAQCHPRPEVMMHFFGEEYARVGEPQTQKAAQCFTQGLELEPKDLPSLMESGQRALDRTDLNANRCKLRKDESCRLRDSARGCLVPVDGSSCTSTSSSESEAASRSSTTSRGSPDAIPRTADIHGDDLSPAALGLLCSQDGTRISLWALCGVPIHTSIGSGAFDYHYGTQDIMTRRRGRHEVFSLIYEFQIPGELPPELRNGAGVRI